MKASELIEKLQEEIKHFGDRELKGSCDDLEGDGMFDIGEIGWFGDKDGKSYITLICAECAYMHRLDHLRGKYEVE